MRYYKIFLIFAILALYPLSFVIAAGNQDYRKRLNHTAYENYNSEDDVKAEINFGREVAARVLGNYPYFPQKRLTRYVNLVGQSLLKFSNRPELRYYFAVLDTDTVNAFSAPGGYIFVTTGAIKAMENEAELAAVLAHEIAHITEKHIVNDLHLRANDKSAVTSFGALVGGSTKSLEVAFNQSVEKAVEVLFKKGFKIEQEKDSDKIATLLLASAGYDPHALLNYLTRVDAQSKTSARVKPTTHPLSADRFAAIKNFIEKENLVTLKLPSLSKRFIKNVNIKK